MGLTTDQTPQKKRLVDLKTYQQKLFKTKHRKQHTQKNKMKEHSD